MISLKEIEKEVKLPAEVVEAASEEEEAANQEVVSDLDKEVAANSDKEVALKAADSRKEEAALVIYR